ncbi:hypothetical protein QJS10_CPB17g00330 [Acorus calamus]|uniref:Zinc finger C3HC4 RING-type domain-containing protein n=1 Tax=Acorus calamus TaxID=4465 RepID=A0AAV9CRE4_ACOCL|nr:hypothetical protein QJS10_CPB17g00330 [Acorus calamus]
MDSSKVDHSRPIFTAQCLHAFHSACIATNVRHGSLTCPVCRAQLTVLPDLPAHWASIEPHRADPVLRILDDSIATLRVHRRSTLRTVRYDDDDPIEHPSPPSPTYPDLRLSLGPVQFNWAHLSVRLARKPPTDVVLVASPNGPHLRLLKQAMALVVFSLRPVDRLSIITSTARILPLRLMSAHGKRAAHQVIDRVFHSREPDPSEGIQKALKVLEDRAHHNPVACVIHVADGPTLACAARQPAHVEMHGFHVGLGSGPSGLVMQEFEEFLARVLGGVIREVQLRIGGDGGGGGTMVRLGELRGGEERRVRVEASEGGSVRVAYSYGEGAEGGFMQAGLVDVCGGDKAGRDDYEEGDGPGGRRRSSISRVERWDCVDPFMARRWAKHLHG